MSDVDDMAVLLMAYGSPDTPDDVEPYYTHIRRGRPPTPELLEQLKGRYALVGGRTPLSDISEATRKGLEDALNAGSSGHWRVYLGMKHWHPYIEQTVGEMARDGVKRAVGLVLAPHFSEESIAGYYRYIQQAQEKWGSHIEFLPIESWHLHEPYLRSVAERMTRVMADFLCGSDVTVIFTAHSLPQRIVSAGDPYPQQLRETAEAIAERLGLERWTFSYQSAGRTPEPWLGPDIVDTVHELADDGVQHILVVPIGFVSEHLEILYDIDYEAMNAARERGVTLKRIEMLNASDDFVQGLADLVRRRVEDVEAGAPT
jgi:protoporphyrin/coproporphyrin ferrochelatase